LDYPGARKLLVGDGPDRARLEKLYPDVEFKGFRTGHALAQCYADADVFVFPSRWETFGIVMIEAMACGTPVAAYPVQGPLDVVDQGVTGFVNEDLTDAITGCLQLDRDLVLAGSQRWSWPAAWQIFRDNLTPL
jgi:glycosyltransferase involved in cell wall biosynthesis